MLISTNIFADMCRYVGDDSGLISVLKYNPEEGKLLSLPYQITSDALNGIFVLVSFLFFCE